MRIITWIIACLLLINLTRCTVLTGDTMQPYNLRCEYMTDPMGIENMNPQLSWMLKSAGRNHKQSAYRILVSASQQNLDKDTGDLWDTGIIQSGKNISIRYDGQPPVSRMPVYWKVMVWDDQGNKSDWSPNGHWEMGLQDPGDWQARWIGTPWKSGTDDFRTPPAPYFRKNFDLSKKIRSARAYVSGLGYYEFSLNGVKVSDNVLVPAQTNYDRRDLRNLLYDFDAEASTRVFYNSYDITESLKPGKNTAGVILGNGWYNQMDRRVEGWLWYDTPRLIMQIEIEYADGERQFVISDDSWRVATGPIVYNGIFTGEHYDARLEKPGWNTAAFDDSDWQPAAFVRAPTGTLRSQLAPPDKVTQTILPVSISNPAEGMYRFDLGQMISGWVRLQVRGNAGDTIRVRHIEEMGSDYKQIDLFILKGEGVEVFEPHFTWHAFRTVEVSGVSNPLKLTDLEGKMVHTAVNTAGEFTCSNGLFNRIYQNYIWTQLGNFHGSFSSDCPHRERLGYTGDGQLLVESSIFNFDMTRFYKKWVDDMDDARNKRTGFVPHTAPFGGGGGGPAWGSSYVIVPWFYYLYYGDTEILEQHYEGMKQWVSYLGTRTDSKGIVVREEPNGWCLGDWANPDGIRIPPPLVNTAFYFYCAKTVSDIAGILGQTADQQRLAGLADKIKDDLNRVYLNTQAPRYWTSEQGADVFPLAFGMVPENMIDGVFANLVNNVDKNNQHLDTGILGTPLLLEVLSEYGREDLAFSIMNQWDYPGFGYYILGKNATTLWEYFDGQSSHSHPMYGSVIRWFYKSIAGINPDPSAPGFRKIIIKPTPCGDLTHARATYESLYGPISTEWHLSDDVFTLAIEIPANTNATVYVPAHSNGQVFENGQPINDENGIYFLRMEKEKAVYQIGSGKYIFTSKGVSDLIKPVQLPTPIISPADTLFHKPGNAEITITAANQADIYYTLDGTEPDKRALRYTEPVLISDKTTVKARIYKEGFLPSRTTSVEIRFIDPKINGIKYTVLEGKWDQRPDPQKLTAVSSGRTFEFDVNKINRRDDWVAIRFEGDFFIGNAGKYTFYASANDGCVVYIDGKIVVDDAGYTDQVSQQGDMALSAGKHSLNILYFENDGTESMNFEIEGPGMTRQAFPPEIMIFPGGSD